MPSTSPLMVRPFDPGNAREAGCTGSAASCPCTAIFASHSGDFCCLTQCEARYQIPCDSPCSGHHKAQLARKKRRANHPASLNCPGFYILSDSEQGDFVPIPLTHGHDHASFRCTVNAVKLTVPVVALFEGEWCKETRSKNQCQVGGRC